MTTAAKTFILTLAVLLAGVNAALFLSNWHYLPAAASAALLILFTGAGIAESRKNGSDR
jgi:hypothetical protein